MRSIWVNGALVRQRMHALGLSERETAESAGVTSTAIRSIVTLNAISTSLILAQVQRLAGTLGTTPSDLLSEPVAESSTGTNDARTLIQILAAQTIGQPQDRLARVLGWDLEQLEAAIASAQGILIETGLVIHEASSGLILRPVMDVSAVQAGLDQLQDNDQGLKLNTAQVLYRALQGALTQTGRKEDRLHLGRLHNLGVLKDDRSAGGGPNDPSPDFRFCLDF